MEEVLRMNGQVEVTTMDTLDLGAMITGAHKAIGHAMALCASTIDRPLAALCNQYWKDAQAALPEGATIMMVDDTELVSNSQGAIYWVRPGITDSVEDPQPPPEQEDEWDSWLVRNGIPTARVAVEPLQVPMDAELWTGNYTQRLRELDDALRTRFNDMVAALREANDPAGLVVVTRPKASMQEGQQPFTAMIYIHCRCGAPSAQVDP